MNAMLDPRMAAARIHLPALGSQGAATLVDRIAASSHGGFMTAMDDQAFAKGWQQPL
jgi:hypothetical protein